METKNYMINDKWLDLDKQNIVELQSVDGVLDSLKVNGSEVVTPSGKITITENGTDIDVAQYALADVNVEGGGGSSDFSTAEVTIINNTNDEMFIYVAILQTNPDASYGCVYLDVEEQATVTVVLYKGSAFTNIPFYGTASSTGNYSNGYITGDGTITITAGE